VFSGLYRYESELMKLNAMKPAASSRTAAPVDFDIDSRYKLSAGAALLNISLPSSELFSGPQAESTPAARTFIVVINTGKRLNIYTVRRDLYRVLSMFRNNEARSCSEMIEALLPGQAAGEIADRLREFHGAGAFMKVPGRSLKCRRSGRRNT